MKVALVTGGTKGIGLGIARKLQMLGYKPVINYFSDDMAAERVNDKYGFKCYKADVSDFSAVKNMVDAIKKEEGDICLLVNSAGIALKQKILPDVSADEIMRTVSVNLIGTINATKAVLDGMIKNREGIIINISSVYGDIGGSCEAVYSATKGGVNAFTKAVAKEVSSAGIRVNAVAPGFIDTDMNAHISERDRKEFCENLLIPRIGTAEDVALAVEYLVKNTYVTGEIINVNGGMV